MTVYRWNRETDEVYKWTEFSLTSEDDNQEYLKRMMEMSFAEALPGGFEKERRVARDILARGRLDLSTVFLSLDHGWFSSEPVLFETMLFPGCRMMERYHTAAEARANHKKLVSLINWAMRGSHGEHAES